MLAPRRVVVPLTIFAALYSTAAAETRQDRVKEAEARLWAQEAATLAKGNVKTFNREFEKRAKKRIRDYKPGGLDLYTWHVSGLAATLYGQVATFQLSASGLVRRLRPVDEAAWRPGVTVSIAVREMTAQQVERVVVKRGETVIEPALNLIAETEVRNLQGAVFKAREGSVVFPAATFEPAKGVQIRVMLIPIAGSNTEMRLTSAEAAAAFERPR